jgi:hypothetical protein
MNPVYRGRDGKWYCKFPDLTCTNVHGPFNTEAEAWSRYNSYRGNNGPSSRR